MLRLLIKINTCLVTWLPVWRAALEGNCIAAEISSATLQFNNAAAYFDIQKEKQKQIGFAPRAIHPASSGLRPAVCWEQEMGSLFSLALGQEVIKQNQTPGAAHAPAMWTAKCHGNSKRVGTTLLTYEVLKTRSTERRLMVIAFNSRASLAYF